MELTSEERMRIAETWNFRYVAELRAARRFARLAVELSETGAAPEVQHLAESAIADERRHAALCKTIALEYGYPYDQHEPLIEAVPLAPPNLDRTDALLFEIVAFCCITETVNTAMLVDTLSFTRVERVRDAVRTILRDEVNHSKLGWAHLAYETARGRGSFLSSVLIPMFGQLGIQEILQRDGSRESQSLAAHGELNDSRRVALFSEAIFDVVLPGLENSGVQTQHLRSWLHDQGVTRNVPNDEASGA